MVNGEIIGAGRIGQVTCRKHLQQQARMQRSKQLQIHS